jgi:membrane protein DedA with SNARE-associated domain
MTGSELAPLVADYGYFATFVGMLLEGETFLVLSGLAANRGILNMPTVVAVGAAGAFGSDNLFFAVGRVLGPALVVRFPRLAPSASKMNALIGRLPNTSVIGVRFLYGMRTVGPAVIGAGTMAWARFAVLDALAAALWAVCWSGAGYVLGESVAHLLGAVTQVGRWLGGSLLVGIVVATLILRRHRRARRFPG